MKGKEKKKMLSTLWGFINKERLQTLRDPRMRVLMFVAPIVQLTIFGVAISNETRNVRLSAQYAPKDSLTRQIYERSLSSRWFIPAEVVGSDPFEWIRSGRADVALVAPKETLARQVLGSGVGGTGNLQVLINAKNITRAQAIESYLRVISSMVAEESALKAPVKFDIRPMYNPTFKTSLYMVPGVMSMLVCLVTILLTSMSVAREKELGTFETLISAPVDASEILLGKTIPFMAMGMVQMPLILTAAIVLFGLPVRGPLVLVAIAAFFFILTTVSIGLLISTIAKNQQQAMMGGMLFLFPAVLLSGLMFPVENMPWPMWIMAQLNPLTHFIGLLRNLLLKGGNFDYFLVHTSVLMLLGGLSFTLASRRFKTTL